MQPQEIFDVLTASYGDAVSDFTPAGAATKDAFCKVKAPRLPEVARTLRDHPQLGFDCLENLTAVDWPKTSVIEVVYHFYSYDLHHDFIVKVELPRAEPKVASLTPLWRGAEWLEREQFDLMGVIFEGHPDLRRLLLPEDWEGHPLRKDYVQAPEYRGMKTSRPSPLDLLPLFDKHNLEQQAAAPAGDKVKP
ncbi:MAG TPA: NADH-quinone oxidoreductase subunit C [Polyangia bacterium]|jgi:NADH-quinone oxidoreductase subunit C